MLRTDLRQCKLTANSEEVKQTLRSAQDGFAVEFIEAVILTFWKYCKI